MNSRGKVYLNGRGCGRAAGSAGGHVGLHFQARAGTGFALLKAASGRDGLFL